MTLFNGNSFGFVGMDDSGVTECEYGEGWDLTFNINGTNFDYGSFTTKEDALKAKQAVWDALEHVDRSIPWVE